MEALKSPDKKLINETLAQLYSRGASPVNTHNSKGLYELIWQPLDKLLKGVETVYYSTSGLMHRINFDAIPISNNQGSEKILSDIFRLVRFGSTRSLVVNNMTRNDSNNEAVLFGGIEYEFDTTYHKPDSILAELSASNTGELSFAYADRSEPQRGGNWNYLPGTEQEVSDIDLIFRDAKFALQLFSGKNATEELKILGHSSPSPRILHIATHGFFFPDPSPSPAFPNREGAKSSPLGEARMGLFLKYLTTR